VFLLQSSGTDVSAGKEQGVQGIEDDEDIEG